MTRWIIWAFVLMAQAGSSTWASRARNSQSVAYHGVAAIFSHGVWFVSNCFLVESLVGIAARGDLWDIAVLGTFYTFFCTIGSMLAHHITAAFFERGTRRIGGHP